MSKKNELLNLSEIAQSNLGDQDFNLIENMQIEEGLSDAEIDALSAGSDLISDDGTLVTVSDIIYGINDDGVESVDLVRRTTPMGDEDGPIDEPKIYRKNVAKSQLSKYDVG
jgi:hypothetical protein